MTFILFNKKHIYKNERAIIYKQTLIYKYLQVINLSY